MTWQREEMGEHADGDWKFLGRGFHENWADELLRQEGKEMKDLPPWSSTSGSCTSILGLLSCSGLLGNFFKDLIMLLKKYIRLGSDDVVPTSWIGQPALILQESPIWATRAVMFLPQSYYGEKRLI